MERRDFVKGLAATGGIALFAGCSDSPAEEGDINLTSNYHLEQLDDGVSVELEGRLAVDGQNIHLPERVEVTAMILDEDRTKLREQSETYDTGEQEEITWTMSIIFSGDDATEKLEGFTVETDIDRLWDDGQRM